MTDVQLKKAPVAQIAAVAVALCLLMLVAGWFLLISPKRSEASKLDGEIAATEARLASARAAAAAANRAQPIRYADLFRLAKAMPDDSDHAGIVLDLNQVATGSGIQFDEIAPGSTQALSGYRVIPIELRFNGNFYNLADFLFRMRNLVGVDDGRLTATGRLFTVEKLVFGESEQPFPHIAARLTVSAFLYGASSTPAPAATSSTTTTTTATTTTTSTPPTAAPPLP